MRSLSTFVKACLVGWGTFCVGTFGAIIVLIVKFDLDSGGGSFWALMFILAIGLFGLILIQALKFGAIAGVAAFVVALIWFAPEPSEHPSVAAEPDEPPQPQDS